MPKYHITDWAGNVVNFNDKTFDTFEDGIAFLNEYIKKEHGDNLTEKQFEDIIGEYEVEEVKPDHSVTTRGEQMLLMLSAESTVEINLLLECPDLIKMIKDKKSKADCLNWINENF